MTVATGYNDTACADFLVAYSEAIALLQRKDQENVHPAERRRVADALQARVILLTNLLDTPAPAAGVAVRHNPEYVNPQPHQFQHGDAILLVPEGAMLAMYTGPFKAKMMPAGWCFRTACDAWPAVMGAALSTLEPVQHRAMTHVARYHR